MRIELEVIRHDGRSVVVEAEGTVDGDIITAIVYQWNIDAAEVTYTEARGDAEDWKV